MLRGRGGRTQTTTRNSTETSTYTPTIFNGPTPATEPASTEPSAPPPAPSSQGGTRNRGNRGHNPRRAGRGTGRASRGSASNRSAVPTGGRRLDESPPSNSTTGRPANRSVVAEMIPWLLSVHLSSYVSNLAQTPYAGQLWFVYLTPSKSRRTKSRQF